jgi:hypothetical protein
MKNEVISHIFHLDSPNKVWNALKKIYESTRIARQLLLKNKFYRLNIQKNLSISKKLFIVKDILGQIVEIGDAIKDENVILTILNVLFNSYENFMQGVSIQILIKQCPNYYKRPNKHMLIRSLINSSAI